MVFILNVRPYLKRQRNYLEAFNECMILLIATISIVLTEVVKDFKKKKITGVSIVIIFSFLFIINISTLLHDKFIDFKKKKKNGSLAQK